MHLAAAVAMFDQHPTSEVIEIEGRPDFAPVLHDEFADFRGMPSGRSGGQQKSTAGYSKRRAAAKAARKARRHNRRH